MELNDICRKSGIMKRKYAEIAYYFKQELELAQNNGFEGFIIPKSRAKLVEEFARCFDGIFWKTEKGLFFPVREASKVLAVFNVYFRCIPWNKDGKEVCIYKRF